MKYVKRGAAAVLFFVGLVGLLWASSWIVTPKNNMKEFGMEEVSANGILAKRTIPSMCWYWGTASLTRPLRPCSCGRRPAIPRMYAVPAPKPWIIPTGCCAGPLKIRRPNWLFWKPMLFSARWRFPKLCFPRWAMCCRYFNIMTGGRTSTKMIGKGM